VVDDSVAAVACLQQRLIRQTSKLYATLCYLSAVHTQPRGEHTEVRARIQGVLQDNTLAHVFQPIRDLKTGATVGHEAPSRFLDPIQGLRT
jgi:sensor c-di-GMP phosphodiesterase-like protein